MITIIGLGVEKGDLTERGKARILAAVGEGKPIVVRTANTLSYQTVKELNIPHTCLDSVYQNSRNFSTIPQKLAKAVAACGDDAVYLVDGAATEDNSVKALIKRLRGKVEMIDGVSKVTAQVRAANFKGCSYTAQSAYELLVSAAGQKALRFSTPLLVYDMDDRAIASDCKLLLGDMFGEELTVQYICQGKGKKIPLYELDRQKTYDYTSAVAIDGQELLEKKRFSLDDLKEIVVRLRRPDGCPWDRVQTPETIKMNVVEEAYELVDAVDSGDDDKVLEETGDIFLQAIFFAVMKSECGSFTLTDVLSGICEKLISRHTHIFGNDKATDAESALSVWDQNKNKEKHQVSFADSVNDVPRAFPAAMRAQKVGKRAGKAGLDFANAEDALKALQAEIAEFAEARKSGDSLAIERELGDVLFSAVNVGRLVGVDCEKALKESTDVFAKRFTLAEKMANDGGRDVTKLSAEEWDGYYRAAKKELQKGEKHV